MSLPGGTLGPPAPPPCPSILETAWVAAGSQGGSQEVTPSPWGSLPQRRGAYLQSSGRGSLSGRGGRRSEQMEI